MPATTPERFASRVAERLRTQIDVLAAQWSAPGRRSTRGSRRRRRHRRRASPGSACRCRASRAPPARHCARAAGRPRAAARARAPSPLSRRPGRLRRARRAHRRLDSAAPAITRTLRQHFAGGRIESCRSGSPGAPALARAAAAARPRRRVACFFKCCFPGPGIGAAQDWLRFNLCQNPIMPT